MNLGPGEILLIAVFALLVFGPKRLPEIARSVGRAVREFQKATGELTRELNVGLEDKPNGAVAEKPQEPRPGPRPE